ncbi:hypothetical protein CROQUDRAFT_62732 [Cronartium quercuum f. sp. fusiforme G11]|uniref:Uncharacterized protein n=1 Tax=Cronartium quercuum f. sp. fusiforme G11 TaxID=708437 RepID=A0A9P6NN13_9BASI|nr:hypothetical protein CROQUDRAFT_62732 [Cronartium quercuum f. sp. fusiforme G11]
MTSSDSSTKETSFTSSSSTPITSKEPESSASDRPKTTHPSFEIIKSKSFGTIMHELWIRYQGEFALSMLETVRAFIHHFHILLLLLLSFFYLAALRYFPSHLKVIISRAKYYLSGQE